MALDTLRAMECRCGCGQPVDVAHDEDTAGRWQVETVVCQAGAALAEWREKHTKDGGMEPGTLSWVRLLPEGESASDPSVFDPERAAIEYERHMQSLGLDA